MRVGLVSYEYPPQNGLGGVGTYTHRLAGALGRAGHQVVVLAGPSEEPALVQPNVRVHRIPARYDPPVDSRGLRWLYWNVLARTMGWANPMVWHWLRWDLASGAALLELDRQAPIDVIEAPEHAGNALVAARMRRWPTIVRIHGPWDLFYGINRTDGMALNRLLAHLERRSVRYADEVTTPSRSMSQFIGARWRLRRLPRVVPNFMNVPQVRAPLPGRSAAQRIVCAGRIERFKGQDILVKAFARLARWHPRAELVLVGPDQWSARESFSQVIDQLVPDVDVRKRIRLAGPLPLARVQQELAEAAVAVVCSTGFESFSFATLEAMGAARPVVASRVGAIPELLEHGRCGWLVDPSNDEQLADAIGGLLSDRELAEDLAGKAHARALAEYDTEAVLPRIVHTYQETRATAVGLGEPLRMPAFA